MYETWDGVKKTTKLDLSNKIDAIKAVRQWGEVNIEGGVGLKEAKDFIEVLIARNRKEQLQTLLKKAIAGTGMTYADYAEVKDTIFF